MTTLEQPRVQRKAENEVLLMAPREEAFAQVYQAIQKLGKARIHDLDKTYVEGQIKYGLHKVNIHATLVEHKPGQTTVVLQGSSGEAWGVAATNVSLRLIDMLENLDNPLFKGDRFGVNPVSLAILGVLVVIFLAVIAKAAGV